MTCETGEAETVATGFTWMVYGNWPDTHPPAVAVTSNNTGSTLPPELVKAWLIFPLPLVMDEGFIVAFALAVQLNTAPGTVEPRFMMTGSAEHHLRSGWEGVKITSGKGLMMKFPLADAWHPAPLVYEYIMVFDPMFACEGLK
jgi:hypothetical protein